ncbi:MAG TPA: AAA family ATPase, partial [Leptospiraceae bacterium]|nr:AAA family ATPase [Leptospiraceae bacterium]
NLPVALIAGIQNTVLYKLDSIEIIRASTWKNQKLVNPTGSNLAGVLEYYKKYNPQIIDSINEILRRNIPSFKEVKTERLGTKNAVFFAVEEQDGHTYSMNELSDGTDYFIAIIAALVVLQYSDLDENNKGLLIIEEPEKCLHPQLLSEIVEIAKLLTVKYQVIITSHSADLVSLLKPEDLLLMDKDENGSRIKRCNSSKQLEAFLKEFSLDQAWLFNELEGGVVYG